LFRELEPTLPHFNPQNAINIARCEIGEEEGRKKAKETYQEEYKKYEQDLADKKLELSAVSYLLSLPEEPVEDTNDFEDFDEWWEKIGLDRDPFITTDGFSQLPRDSYDKIIVRNDIINKYYGTLQKNPESFFYKTYMFFGEYGSGKTTLFHFIENGMINYNIYPIHLILRPEQTEKELTFAFEKELLERLKEEIYYESSQQNQVLNNNDLFYDIKNLMKNFSNTSGKGFIIFIDGLNQSTECTPALIKFLKSLQPFRTNLVQNKIKVGIFIAAAIEWYDSIIRDPSLSGSIETKEKIPEVTSQEAFDMLNKRFEAFARNKETFKKIKISFIQQIFREMENQRLKISYRTFIERLRNELSKGNFEIMDIAISPELISSIKLVLESNNLLKFKINKLLYSSGIETQENRVNALKLLVKVYTDGFIEDSKNSEILHLNAPYFQRLLTSGLIVRAQKGLNVGFVICEELKEANKTIFDKYNRSLDDYLIPVYEKITKKAPLKKITNSDEIKEIIRGISNNKTELIKLNLKKSFQTYEKIALYLNDPALEITDDLMNDSKISFDDLSLAFFNVEKSFEDKFLLAKNTNLLWRNHWYQSDKINEYLDRSARKPLVESDKRLFCRAFTASYEELASEISRIQQAQDFIPKELLFLSIDQIKIVLEIYEHWRKEEFYEIIEKISKDTQKKLRDFLWDVFTLLYGEYSLNKLKWLDRIPDKIRSYIKAAQYKSETAGFEPNENIFYNLNRGNYRELLTQNNAFSKRNWGEIFKFVLTGWNQQNFDDFLNSLAFSLIETEHYKDSKPDRQFTINLFHQWVSFSQKINRAYLHIVQDGLFKDESTQNCFYISFKGYEWKDNEELTEKGVQDKKALCPIYLQEDMRDEIKCICENIKNELEEVRQTGALKFDLLQGNKKYKVSYRAFIFTIAYLLQHHKLDINPDDKPKIKLNVILEQAPFIHVKSIV
jgi:hypothetical protein